jgi:membrane-associated phospholipid phosphatase
MLISDLRYSNWQKRIAEKVFFRRFWVFWGIYSVALVFIVALYLVSLGQIKIVGLAFAAFVLARVIISPLIFLLYKKQRPYQKLNFTTFYSRLFSAQTIKLTSFPSDHAISFAAISAVFCWYFPYLGFILIPTTLLNGLARIILGYHYVIDVAAAWVLGILSAILVICYIAPLLFTR